MKAPNEIIPFDHESIIYPMMESRKFDGFRMLMPCGEALLSPSLKPFANLGLLDHFMDVIDYAKRERIVFDGEVWSPDLTFQALQSLLRSVHKTPPLHVEFYIFDAIREDEWLATPYQGPSYEKRYYRLMNYLMARQLPNVKLVEHQIVHNSSHALEVFDRRIAQGQEGSMLNSMSFGYKHGRCTQTEGGLFKFKEFITYDAVIIEPIIQRKLKDGVDRTFDQLGNLERVHTNESYELDTKIAGFIVQWNGTRFSVKLGKGFNDADKTTMFWTHEGSSKINHYGGRTIEFKYMPHGTMHKPRIGSMVRFRPDKD